MPSVFLNNGVSPNKRFQQTNRLSRNWLGHFPPLTAPLEFDRVNPFIEKIFCDRVEVGQGIRDFLSI